MKTYFTPVEKIERKWYVADADGKTLSTYDVPLPDDFINRQRTHPCRQWLLSSPYLICSVRE